MEEFKTEKNKKIGYGSYVKLLIFVCLIVLAIFLATWLWWFIGALLIFWIFRKFKK